MYTYNSASLNTALGANTVSISPPTGSLVAIYSVTSGGGGTPTVVFSDDALSVWSNASNNVSVSGHHVSVGYTLASAVGMTTITATYNGGTPGTCDLLAVAYTGLVSPSFVAVSAPNVQASPGTGANAITANALNCGAINALMLVLSDELGNHSNMSAGTGYTLRFNSTVSAGDGMAVEDPGAEVTGSQTGTYTSTNGSTDTFVTLSIAFADNVVGPAPTSYQLESSEYF